MNQDYINDLCYRLITRSNIRKGITSRKSVQEGKEDRLCLLLEEAAKVISYQQAKIDELMLEYCHEEMSPEQIEAWKNSMKAIKDLT